MAEFAAKVREAHDAFNNRDFERSATTLLSGSSTYIDHGTGETMNGPTEFIGWLERHLKMSSDIQIVDAEYFESVDLVVARFRGTGTQDGPMAFYPPSNKSFSFDVCEIYHLGTDGLVKEAHGYSDAFGVLMQLGHIEPPTG